MFELTKTDDHILLKEFSFSNLVFEQNIPYSNLILESITMKWSLFRNDVDKHIKNMILKSNDFGSNGIHAHWHKIFLHIRPKLKNLQKNTYTYNDFEWIDAKKRFWIETRLNY